MPDSPFTMPTRLLPILFLMFGVQSSTSMLTMRVASLPHLKTPGGPSCSSRRLPLAMTLVPGSRSSIPGGRDGDSARGNRPLEFSEAARDTWPPASALETSETRGATVDEVRSVESHLTPGPILASCGFGAATLAAQACFTDWAQLERDAAAVWTLLPPEAASGLAEPPPSPRRDPPLTRVVFAARNCCCYRVLLLVKYCRWNSCL